MALAAGSTSTVSITTARSTEVVSKKALLRSNVTIVLDVSGSMADSKLDQAKQCIMELDAALLKPGDRLSIVIFNDTVETKMLSMKKVPAVDESGPYARTVYDTNKLRRLLASIRASGRTALFDAMDAAIAGIEAHVMKRLKDGSGHTGARPSTAVVRGGGRVGAAAAAAAADTTTKFMQLIVLTDGADVSSVRATASSVGDKLRHPGSWAGRCNFHTCLVGVGGEAHAVLSTIASGSTHVAVVNSADGVDGIKDGFKRVTTIIRATVETLTTVFTAKVVTSASTKRR